MTRHKTASALIVLLLLISSTASEAADYPVTGKISSFYLSGGSNYAFRVWLSPAITACPQGWGYMNTSFDNYQAYVVAFLSAQAQGRQVTLLLTDDGNGFCRILEMGF